MLGPYDEVKERLDKWSGTKDTLQTRLMYNKKITALIFFIAQAVFLDF